MKNASIAVIMAAVVAGSAIAGSARAALPQYRAQKCYLVLTVPFRGAMPRRLGTFRLRAAALEWQRFLGDEGIRTQLGQTMCWVKQKGSWLGSPSA